MAAAKENHEPLRENMVPSPHAFYNKIFCSFTGKAQDL